MLTYHDLFQTVKTKLSPTVRQLLENGLIDWYSFLIHDKKSGSIPTEDNDFYFHLRFSVSKDKVMSEVFELILVFA